MWVFYLISLPLTLGMVVFTLRYFAGPDVPRYVRFTVGYAWFCSLSIIILVPADIWTTISKPENANENGGISFFWSWSYWGTFLLTCSSGGFEMNDLRLYLYLLLLSILLLLPDGFVLCRIKSVSILLLLCCQLFRAVVPLIQGFEDAGDFSVTERLKTSVHVNLVFYSVVGSIGLVGLILLITMNRNWSGGILGLAMALSNTFGLVTGAFLLGFGLSEIPKTLWRNADWTIRQKVLSHKVAKMTMKLDEAHQELSNAIVVAQATSKQMSKRDPLRPYMDVIDNMLAQMFREDPSFKPQGGKLGENDMDYDSDEKSMATLRRHLRLAREEYYRYKSEYMTYVSEALHLEDTIKNYECRSSTGWKYVSSFRPGRTGKTGTLLDTIGLIRWVSRTANIEADVLAKAVFIWRCILWKQLKKILAVILGIISAAILLAEATLLPRGVDLSLFSILINSVKEEEVLVQRMGNIDDAVPFFGKGFNNIYPLIMVVYTLLVAGNFFDHVVGFFGNWKRLRFQTEADDMDGFDPSGLIILEKERSWLEQGCQVGEQVIPLARNFNGADIEHGNNIADRTFVEMKAATISATGGVKGSPSRPTKEETRKYASSREVISNKYAAMREQGREMSNPKLMENKTTSARVSVLEASNSHSGSQKGGPSSGLASTWRSMKSGFQNFKANIEARKLVPLRQNQEGRLIPPIGSSDSESLDEIFQRLKRPSVDHSDENEEEDDKEI
ncbi:homeobox-leucine zipper protein ATHB-6-like [Hibiscus syriacus]|uniref:Homeobox-leucine zipper protein ATHB-6-like n=1 Tax=Hibiscus syriacus TaxID=106335 RepID=A0A6A3C940_HIBSY|nr:homeobox-leucine zipper protein ATHB-6-like [Hibiscus syriacus]